MRKTGNSAFLIVPYAVPREESILKTNDLDTTKLKVSSVAFASAIAILLVLFFQGYPTVPGILFFSLVWAANVAEGLEC